MTPIPMTNPKPEAEVRELQRRRLEERRVRDLGKFFDWLEKAK